MNLFRFVFLLFIAAVISDAEAVTSKNGTTGTRITGSASGPGSKTPPKGSKIKAKPYSTAKDFLTSIMSSVDDRILVHLGDELDRLFGNHGQDQQQTSSTTQPPVVQPKQEVPIPFSGELIRLRAEKGYMNAGVVEVYRTGRWGLVCDDAWDVKDANVACRQLGFKQGAKGAPGEARYGVPASRWRSEDILMDDVECEGNEASLQRCVYKDRHDCTPSEAASVVCTPNFGCPDGWIGSEKSCYRFYGGARNFKAASIQCRSLNASLVSIESAHENNFLSNVISLTAAKNGEHVWFTSGRLNKNAWRWFKTVPRVARRGKSRKAKKGRKGKSGKKGRGKGKKKPKSRNTRASRVRMRNVRASIDVSKWFPGWNLQNGLASAAAEPTVKKSHTCLVLTDMYPLPNGTEISVDYYYWRTSRCRLKGQTISFICEKPALPSPKECYTGTGEDYRGLMSHTDRGTACLPWTSTVVTNETHPGKGIGDHNYCRNPDGDKRPWCWVARGKFGFCPIPLCSSTTAAPSTTTTVKPETLNCPSDEFYCKSNRKCIPQLFVCDGEDDCSLSEDEGGCDYKSKRFEKYPGKIPDTLITNLTYANSPLETCAKLCLKNTHFTCVSFVYNDVERKCQLLNQKDDQQTRLRPNVFNDYYLLKTEAENCTGKFFCKNQRCIPTKDVCNGHDDCWDLSDEDDCTTIPPPMSVRLAEGNDENEGRVEVQYLGEWGTVCDDEWDIRDAFVVCKMLGYTGAKRAAMMGEFGAGKGNIMLDEVGCTGTEENLRDCKSNPLKQHDCQPFEAAGVVCETNKTCKEGEFACRAKNLSIEQCLVAREVCDGSPSCSDASDEKECDLKVELVNGNSSHEGRVEVSRNGVLGTVCDDDWGPEEATVVCRMLGYKYGGEALSDAHFGTGSSAVIWMDELKCTGAEKSLADCIHNGWTINDCSNLEDASVRCFTVDVTTASPSDIVNVTDANVTDANVTEAHVITTDVSTDVSTSSPVKVRVFLMDGKGPHEGRVEIEVDGKRGTICDDSFNVNSAAVICRMAGFDNGGDVVPDAGFGEGKVPIILDEVQCVGNETLVTDCKSLPLESHNCQTSEAVGVVCAVPDASLTTTIRTTMASTTTTTESPTDSSSNVQCGLRPMERKIRRKRQSPSLRALPVTEKPRFQKIVGGDLAQHGMYPWQMFSLRRADEKAWWFWTNAVELLQQFGSIEKIQVGVNKIYNIYDSGEMLVSHWCGATIIDKYWIISAAHCFKNLAKSHVLVNVGNHGLKTKDQGEQKFLVEELVTHENYESGKHDYDIALLKVKSKDGDGIKFNEYVQPACLPDKNTPYIAGTKCHISGWGETGQTDGSSTSYPNHLRKADVPLLPFTTCNYLYKGDLSSRMLCAGYLEGGIDSCQGDSGGPLVCKIKDAYTLMGVTSWGFGCAKPNAPGVYSRTKEFLDWIEFTMVKFS